MMNNKGSGLVVITGATAGIGLATARMFSDRGYKVCCLQRRNAEGFISFPVDVTDVAAVAAARDRIIEEFGVPDVVVCNAGMGISGSVEDTAPADAHAIFEVNFFGALNIIQAFLPSMREKGGGTIITVSSAAAPLAIPFQAFYSATKAALTSLTEALRTEVAPFGVKVTSVLPGDVRTEFTAARRKNAGDNPAYGDRVARSVAVMERDERNGMPPSVIARLIVSLAERSNLPVYKVGGKKYAALVAVSRVLPKRLVSYIIAKLYG